MHSAVTMAPLVLLIALVSACSGKNPGTSLKTKHNISWFCTKADSIDILRFADMPPKAETDCELSFYLWQNEYSFDALNLVNCSEKEKKFALSVSPLAIGDKYISSVPFVSIRRTGYVYSKNAGFFANWHPQWERVWFENPKDQIFTQCC